MLVARGDQVHLHKGYGFADLGLEAPANDETVYHVVVGQVPGNLHDSFAQYRRTYRVFDENGRLMIEPLGEGPERLLKQEDGKFAFRSSPESEVSFLMQNDRAAAMKLEKPGFPLTGDRVGDADPATFHRQLH